MTQLVAPAVRLPPAPTAGLWAPVVVQIGKRVASNVANQHNPAPIGAGHNVPSSNVGLSRASAPARAPPPRSPPPRAPSSEELRNPRILNTKVLEVPLFSKFKTTLSYHSLVSCQPPLLRPGQLSAESRAKQSKRGLHSMHCGTLTLTRTLQTIFQATTMH